MHTMMRVLGKKNRGAVIGLLSALALVPLSLAAAENAESTVGSSTASASAETPAPAQATDSPSAATNGKPAGSSLFKSAISPVMSAADAISKTSVYVAQHMREEVLRLHDFFDVTLPGIAARNHLILDFEPKVGDLIRREFVRFPLRARYGISSQWEAYGGVTPVVPNPIDSGVDHRWSMGMAELGMRYELPANTLLFKRISLGFEGRQPLGNAPVDLIDGYMHLRPYILTSRPMPGMKDTTLFMNFLYDHSIEAPGHEDVPPEVVKRHMIEAAPGLLYKPGQFGYFGQYALRYWDEPVGYRLEHLIKVGVIWDMPLARSAKLRLPGKWQVELGYKLSHLDGESLSHGVHARVKVRTDFFRRHRTKTTAP